MAYLRCGSGGGKPISIPLLYAIGGLQYNVGEQNFKNCILDFKIDLTNLGYKSLTFDLSNLDSSGYVYIYNGDAQTENITTTGSKSVDITGYGVLRIYGFAQRYGYDRTTGPKLSNVLIS